MLPQSILDLARQTFGAEITAASPVSGGDINQAARVELNTGQIIFVKWHEHPPAGMFPAEALGLRLLAQAGGLRVPGVHFFDETCLAIEWLGPVKRGGRPEAIALGEGLAQQHRHTGDTFGLDTNNYCGLTSQINTPADTWSAFFGNRRLAFQMDLAAKKGRMPARRRQKLESLIGKLPDLLPATPPASLLHGDLWGGNWLVAADGRPALIDPAVYYGHRETDLAFTELFGGFSPEFYRAYQSAWPLEPGYSERKEIYNLYHLLNHLNLFGESYGGGVDSVLSRYG